LTSVDSASVQSHKKLRIATHDVDADDDDDDDSDVGAPAPAVAASPAEVVAAAPVSAAAAPSIEVEEAAQDTAVQMHEMMEQAEEMFDNHNVSDPRNKHKEELAGLMYIEEVYEQKLDELDDDNYAKEIEKEEVPVANETSPGLANMLGEMREEMHQYAIPFYKKFLKQKLSEAQAQQHKLVTEIAEETTDAKPKEEKPQTTEKPTEEKSQGSKRITTNNMMYALALVVVLAAIAFFLSQRRN